MFRRAPHRAARRQQLRGLVVTPPRPRPKRPRPPLATACPRLPYRGPSPAPRGASGVRAHLCAKPAHLVRVRAQFGFGFGFGFGLGFGFGFGFGLVALGANLVHIVHEDAHGAEAEAECVERRESIAEEHDGAQDAEELLGAYAGSK